MGLHLSPRYGQVILVSGYPVLTTVNWSQHWCTICVQYQSSCATKLARKCEIEHWFSCGADGRAGCGRCTVTWLPNFLGWVDLLTHGAPQARFAHQSSANKGRLRKTEFLNWVMDWRNSQGWISARKGDDNRWTIRATEWSPRATCRLDQWTGSSKNKMERSSN